MKGQLSLRASRLQDLRKVQKFGGASEYYKVI